MASQMKAKKKLQDEKKELQAQLDGFAAQGEDLPPWCCSSNLTELGVLSRDCCAGADAGAADNTQELEETQQELASAE